MPATEVGHTCRGDGDALGMVDSGSGRGMGMLAFVHARRAVGAMGWAMTGEVIAYRSGWVSKNVTLAWLEKVQAIATHESPFDRRSGMARVRVDTAGASCGSHRVDIAFLPLRTARDLHRILAERAATIPFTW